ncbi:MAG: SDR family NAD(P)-dependent oxidoreductase [Chloroflexota bacterium]|nr:SDR family NAD(P)-dependent oxidoreductase [Chloroflexota bacterium]
MAATRELRGKVAIVTGGSRGIGRSVCMAFAAAGAQVVVASRTIHEPPPDSPFLKYGSGTINDTAKQIAEAGGEALAIPCDVTRSEDLRHLADRTVKHFGRIDIVVSNAGVDCESPVVDLEEDLLDRCLTVNVRGPILLCKYVLPAMIEQKSGGSIFCISSGASVGSGGGGVGYSMSKAALDRAFLSIAEEVREHDVAVNVLSPGRVDTWMNRHGDWPGTAHIPMEQPNSINDAAVWLAAQKAFTFSGHRVERSEFGANWGPGIAAPAP